MKKLALAALALVFTAGAAFAAEAGDRFIKTKLGADIGTSFKYKVESESVSGDVNLGISLGGEYLYAINDVFSIGAGLQYLLPRNGEVSMGGHSTEVNSLSWLPIYATVQANPISEMKEMFFKANIGYSVLFDFDIPEAGSESLDKKGGLYWAIGAGYEFPSGLTLEATYESFYSSASSGHVTVDLPYGKIGISAGYKFKL